MTAGMSTLHCVAFGVSFQLAADSDSELAQMLELAPLGTRICTASSAGSRRFALLKPPDTLRYRLLMDDGIVAESADLKGILDEFARELMVHVANHAPDRIFIHAGVVGWQGRAIVLPGTSFAGKTTLVAELVRAGATYYSDEYAVADDQGRVHPYPRDLQMRQDGSFEQKSVTVESLKGCVGATPLPVSQVVFTEYVERGRWLAEPMSAGMAALEMLRHAIPVQRTPARVMAALAKMMESATAVRSERGEAGEVAKVLLNSTPAAE